MPARPPPLPKIDAASRAAEDKGASSQEVAQLVAGALTEPKPRARWGLLHGSRLLYIGVFARHAHDLWGRHGSATWAWTQRVLALFWPSGMQGACVARMPPEDMPCPQTIAQPQTICAHTSP